MSARIALFLVLTFLESVHTSSVLVFADEAGQVSPHPQRILLLGQKADTHPKTTHEYMAGMRLVARLLQDQPHVQVIVVQADSPWTDGPEMIDGADGVCVFLTEGAKWIGEDSTRLSAFRRLAERGGGLACLHWGMGTKEAPPVPDFVALFGGCHGGPDRRFAVTTARLSPASIDHPVLAGVCPIEVHDEFYFELKFPSKPTCHVKLLTARINDEEQPIAWAWERPDGGRSFGYTGLHFHENWKHVETRRLVIQGILWTLKQPIPTAGLPVAINAADIVLPEE